MKRYLRSRLFTALLVAAWGFVALVPHARAQDAASGSTPRSADQKQDAPIRPKGPSLATATQLYRAREYEKAAAEYNAVIAANPTSSNAYGGLARVRAGQSKLTDALAAANQAVEMENDNPNAHIALGEVYFRMGKIPEAEAEFIPIVKSGRAYARAYLGEARVSWASSYYKQAKRMIDLAYELDSADPDISDFWMYTRSLEERVEVAKQEHDKEKDVRPENRQELGKILEALTGDERERHSCRPVSIVTTVEVPFEMLLYDPKTYSAVGLKMGINGVTATLVMDTGATGILLGRRVAEKAGVSRVTDASISGIGDRGDQSGYLGHVDSVRVGGIEFRDCYVHVIDKKTAIGDDGLVGADLFRQFLVDLDFSGRKFRLLPLPALPDDNSHASSVDQQGAEKLRDRYIAPEMKSYTPVFRFGHELLVPTKINDTIVSLFLIDSGSMFNSISPAAAHEVTKVALDSYTTVTGLSGNVKKVYSADRATLTFGHLRQQNQDITAFDTTALSSSIGTEVSGILGFTTLGMLDLKIDYRDGLVDFTFDQHKWCQGKCR